VFGLYNSILYNKEIAMKKSNPMSEAALEGEKIWQENNCTACHQIYGLGGYLGPDLTNIISNPKKGKKYAKGMFNSGIKSMPKFNFSKQEKEHLAEFLEHIDKTGHYPDKHAKIDKLGWVTLNYK